ncbi:MAG TPA: RIP metalloprotease RseP [Albitalea sp.]|uniref:RIP metalloprotease RseP n=1 Tax=Piscinibacter sp. TaxID=1903157 RepID=UPI002ED3691E
MIELLAFIVTLGVLIVIHEYGHYRVAVACGVKVLRFSVGFGRTLWRRQATPDSTEFVVAALPFGGYVRMLDEREGPVPPHERHLAFNRKPLWQRTAVVAAGPIANLLLAVVLYAAANWIGLDEPQALLSTPTAGSLAEKAGVVAGDLATAVSSDGNEWRELRSLTDLRWAVTHAVMEGEPLHLKLVHDGARGEHEVVLPLDTLGTREVDPQLMRRIGLGQAYGEAIIESVVAGGPAAAAGLARGDRVLSIDGRAVEDRARLLDLVRASAAQGEPPTMTWRIDRQGQTLELPLKPNAVGEGDKRVGRIEALIGRAPKMVQVRYGLVEGLTQAVSRTWEMSAVTLKMLGRMLIGQASLKNLSGPLTIADYAGQSVKLGLAYYLGFLAVVSVSLGVLNLLPLPMLDGGHLMYYLFEAVTGRPVSEQWLERLQRGGVAIMLVMMSLALYNDVARLLGLH